MPHPLVSPLLRGAAEGARRLLDDNVIVPVFQNLGHSSQLRHPKYSYYDQNMTHYGTWKFPKIPYGDPTTIIPVAFPLTRAPTKATELAPEAIQVTLAFIAALVIWMIPTLCINKKLCNPCFRKFLSKWLSVYFCFGLVVNFTIISVVIARAPHIKANALFFAVVALLEKVINSMQKVLIQLAALGVVIGLWLFRKKIGTLLGLDQALFRASLRDLLTGFSMKRFRTIEVSLWRAEQFPVGFSSRTLFMRVTLGFNEAQHTRPTDNVKDVYSIKDRIQLNYDPEDDTQRLSLMIKQQEIIGASVNQLLPAAGAVVGAVGGMTTPLGATPGAALGVITGTGAANSVGAEVARVDLSSTMVNRIRQRCQSDSKSAGSNTQPTVKWVEEHFQKVDLIPQGYLWVRIVDVD